MTAVLSSVKSNNESENLAVIDRVYNKHTQDQLKQQLNFIKPFTSIDHLEKRQTEFSKTEIIFSTWTHPVLTVQQIQTFLPNLKYIFYAAGSVKYFAKPYMNCGVRIFSAADENGVAVAEFCAAQILLSNKGYYQSMQIYSNGDPDKAHKYISAFPGNYGENIGIIGAGKIGRSLIGMLKNQKLKILVFDPYLPEEIAKTLDIELCSLDEIFEKCAVISNHLADNEQTKGILNYRHFSKMKPYATFINTGRGAQVIEDDLVRALREVTTRTAILDVTWPEPCNDGHPFYSMPNVFLTPHIAGCMGNEVAKLGESMADEWDSIKAGKPSPAEVTENMLETMA